MGLVIQFIIIAMRGRNLPSATASRYRNHNANNRERRVIRVIRLEKMPELAGLQSAPRLQHCHATDSQHLVVLSSRQPLMRRQGTGKAIPRNLPIPVLLSQDEELLICFRAFTTRLQPDFSCGCSARKSVLSIHERDFDDVEVDRKGYHCEGFVISCRYGFSSHGGGEVLRHKYAI